MTTEPMRLAELAAEGIALSAVGHAEYGRWLEGVMRWSWDVDRDNSDEAALLEMRGIVNERMPGADVWDEDTRGKALVHVRWRGMRWTLVLVDWDAYERSCKLEDEISTMLEKVETEELPLDVVLFNVRLLIPDHTITVKRCDDGFNRLVTITGPDVNLEDYVFDP
jgi:hypothetical protein